MEIGVSTSCLYPMKTEEAFRRCVDLGFRTIEVFFNAPCELEGPCYREMQSIQQKEHIVIPAVHPFTSFTEPFFIFSRYRRRFEDAREFYKKYFEAAAGLGAKLVTLHGDNQNGSLSLEEYCERFAVLRADAATFGVRLAQENVVRYRSADPTFLEGMRRILKNEVDFVLDVKQAQRAGYSPFAVLKAMGTRVAHVHLSDHDAQNSCLVPGRGEFDFHALFDQLQNLSFPGDCVIELYRENFQDESELYEASKFLISRK